MWGCSKDDGGNGGDTTYYLTLGNLNIPAGKIVTDNQTVLYITANHAGLDQELDNKRVVAGYQKLKEVVEAGKKNYEIELLLIDEVQAKAPVYGTGEYGDEPVNVVRTWFGGNYLNVNYMVLAGNMQAHVFNMVINEEHPDADEKNIYAELRHSAEEDSGTEYKTGYVSFDLTQIVPDGESSVTINLSYTDYEGNTITETGIFVLDETLEASLN